MQTSWLIAFEGMDGSGKSTVSRLVHERLQTRMPRLQYVERKNPPLPDGYARQHLQGLARIIWAEEKERLAENPFGAEHWILLLASWFSALQHLLFEPAARSGTPLLMECWYYRLIAKLVLGGHDRAWMQSLFRAVRQPDVMVCLDIDPALSWRRRERFTEFEKGGWSPGEGHGYTRFHRFQESVRAELLEMAAKGDWLLFEQREGLEASRLADEICERIWTQLQPAASPWSRQAAAAP